MNDFNRSFGFNPGNDWRQGFQMPTSDNQPYPAPLAHQGFQMPTSDNQPYPAPLAHQGFQMPTSDNQPYPAPLQGIQSLQLLRPLLAFNGNTGIDAKKLYLEYYKKYLEQLRDDTAEYQVKITETLSLLDKQQAELDQEAKEKKD